MSKSSKSRKAKAQEELKALFDKCRGNTEYYGIDGTEGWVYSWRGDVLREIGPDRYIYKNCDGHYEEVIEEGGPDRSDGLWATRDEFEEEFQSLESEGLELPPAPWEM